MKLTFLSAQERTGNQSGTVYAFLYQINNSTLPHSVHIVGKENRLRYNTQDDINDYAQRLFAGALFVIESLWDKTRQLPDEQHNYAFPDEAMQAIPWEGYELVLTE